jgi:hypothetical protein
MLEGQHPDEFLAWMLFPPESSRGVNEDRLLLGLIADHHAGDPMRPTGDPDRPPFGHRAWRPATSSLVPTATT